METKTVKGPETVRIGSTERTQRLRENLISKACYNGKYSDGVYVDVERAVLLTESYQATEGDNPVLRRAKGLRHVLANIPIAILKDELIVGNPHADPHALPIFPEVNVNLLKEAIEDGYVREQDRDKAMDLVNYWEKRTIANMVEKNMSEHTKEIVNTSSSFISTTWKDGIQHCVPNWDYTFEHGTNTIRKKIEAKLEEVKTTIDQQNSTQLSELIHSRDLYEAMLISLDGVNRFTERCSELARQEAKKATGEHRSKELRDMSEMLARALKEPPQTFHEACQGFFTLHLILNCIDSAAFGSLSRIDQCLYPFFKKDVLEEKNINESDAQEIIETLMLKVQALGGFFSRKRRLHFEGNGALPIWTIGGVKTDGSDACNELTDTILRAAQSIRCNQPTISILYHKKMRESSLREAINTVKLGMGYPSFTNNDWVIDSLMRQGMPIEAARNAGVVGCVSVCPVDSNNTTKRLALTIIAGKAMELALNQGKCLITGKQIGPEEKPASEFKSYEEVYKAVEKQLQYAIKMAVNVRNLARHYEKQYRPNPLASALHRSPIEKGIDTVSYEDYPNNYWLNLVGVVNIVNSLAVMKKLVFEEKKYSLNNLIEAIHNNWEGNEALRQEAINKVPKFGNDEAYVDHISKEVFNTCSNIGEQTFDINGGYWSILAQSVSIYQATAKLTGAMPDGKRQGEPLADGGISPDHGTNKNGIFSVLNSVGKVDHTRTKGLLLNQWIAPEMLEGETGIEWMKALLEMWHENDCSQMQINVVDPKVLRDAQKHPEKYPHLTVRVSGYTANWIHLTEDLQEMILARTMQRS